MDRINGADTVDIGGGKRGFQDEDLLGPVTGTEVTALWLNMVQEEIAAVVEASGMELDPADWSQLLKALRSGKLSFAVAGGTANALTIDLPTAIDYTVGMKIRFMATLANTGAVTANVNGKGAKVVVKPDLSALMANHFSAGGIYELTYDGTRLIILSAPRPATQDEVDAGLTDAGYVTPKTLAKEKPSYMSAKSNSAQTVPSAVWTTLTTYAAPSTNFRGASTFASGVLTIGSGDEGLWFLGQSLWEDNLGTTGQATRITVNGVEVSSDGHQTSSDVAVGRSASSAVLPLAVGDVVAFQVIQTSGASKTFDSYRVSAARVGNA